MIFSGILTFLLLTARDNNKLNSTLDETFDFVKNRIESYEIYNTRAGMNAHIAKPISADIILENLETRSNAFDENRKYL